MLMINDKVISTSRIIVDENKVPMVGQVIFRLQHMMPKMFKHNYFMVRFSNGFKCSFNERDLIKVG